MDVLISKSILTIELQIPELTKNAQVLKNPQLHFQISFQNSLYNVVDFPVMFFEYEVQFVIVSDEHELQVFGSPPHPKKNIWS